MGRFCLAMVVGLAVLAFAGQASASTPQSFVQDFQNADTIDCSQFNDAWTFNDDFVDFFHDSGKVWFDADGNPVRMIEHLTHVSNDVNSETLFTLHEHNHFTITTNFVSGVLAASGAFNIMQRRGVGEVIQNTGHRLFDFNTGDFVVHGPARADDADFCAAVAP